MGKGKPRHNPCKPQNKYGSWCQWAEEFEEGTVDSSRGYKGDKIEFFNAEGDI